ncbi:MAG: AAA family ATPase [Pirellulales bacterium]|nr:AAA family ATPase [Pirellulales bacterium]
MLTRLRIHNLKRFDDVDIELGQSVVLIGPNNSGKTSALQAIALWDVGMRQWNTKRSGKDSPSKRPGVAINRKDVSSIPIPTANLLWRDLHVRDSEKTNGKQRTKNVRIDIILDGVTKGTQWSCGLEYDYTNEESFVCRPLRKPGFEDVLVGKAEYSNIPDEATAVQVAYLPPMSGLADREFIKQTGEINFLIGQGQTAQVLRNLCYQISSTSDSKWLTISDQINELFGARLLEPTYINERSEIILEYEERGTKLDLSCSGRGLQQVLLLLSHLYAHPGTVLLLDEPDAHLEILRQRQVFELLTNTAEEQGSQIVAASHSEIVLNEAVGRSTVVAFVGKPHTINNKSSQVRKALNSLGWDQYYQAEQTGWVLYLEGPSDLAILQALAESLRHEASKALARPFVHYVATNLPEKAREHYYGLREAKPDLPGIAIFDRIERGLDESGVLRELMWSRKEIENYICTEEVLLSFAKYDLPDDLFGAAEADRRRQLMIDSIRELSGALQTLGHPDPWSDDLKVTDEFLDPLFKRYFEKLGLPLAFRKSDYHVLAGLISPSQISPEVAAKLDAIVEVWKEATPST